MKKGMNRTAVHCPPPRPAFLFLAMASIAMFATSVPAAEPEVTDPEVRENITRALEKLHPSGKLASIQLAPVPTLYQVLIDTEVLYFTRDARFVFVGTLYDMKAGRNLTEEQAAEAKAVYLQALDPEDYIEFDAQDAQHAVYVFTDVDCGYCRKMHSEIDEYNRSGTSIRYLAYPRAGVDTPTGVVMRNVWCAGDRREALTLAKQGRSIEDAQACGEPVAEQYRLGMVLGITGTPAIFTEDGMFLGGYIPAASLSEALARK